LGDFNGRTSNDDDFIHLDKNRHGDDFIDFINDDLVTLDELEIPRKRKSMDKVKNGYGNKLLELCRGNSLFLLNGRVGEDMQHEGRLTCKISSTVDYCLCTVYLLKYINNFKILDFSSLYSNVHSPIQIKILKRELENNFNHIAGQTLETGVEKIKRWDNEKCVEFRNNIKLDKIDNLKNKILSITQSDKTKVDINSLSDDLCQIFIESATSTFGTKLYKTEKTSRQKQVCKSKPWFNEECKISKEKL